LHYLSNPNSNLRQFLQCVRQFTSSGDSFSCFTLHYTCPRRHVVVGAVLYLYFCSFCFLGLPQGLLPANFTSPATYLHCLQHHLPISTKAPAYVPPIAIFLITTQPTTNSTSLTGYCTIVPTSRNQIYQSPRRHHVSIRNTHLYSFFIKTIFQKLFWALSRDPRIYCPPFSNSPYRDTYPQIFSNLSTSILTSFFTVFNLLMIILPPRDWQSQTRVTNLRAVTHTWPTILSTSPLRLEGSGGYLPPTSPLRHTLLLL